MNTSWGRFLLQVTRYIIYLYVYLNIMEPVFMHPDLTEGRDLFHASLNHGSYLLTLVSGDQISGQI